MGAVIRILKLHSPKLKPKFLRQVIPHCKLLYYLDNSIRDPPEGTNMCMFDSG